MIDLNLIGQKAREASYLLAKLSTMQKNSALEAIADALVSNGDFLIKANMVDVKNAREKGVSGPLIDRLTLNEKRIRDMADGLRQIVALPDPVGEVVSMWKRPNGLVIGQQRVPLGVVGIIYESRPNVTVDAAGLCLKSGNAVILKGGSDALESNRAIVEVMNGAASKAGIPDGAITLIEDVSRETTLKMMKMNKYIDVLIPRGGASLIQAVVENATVPVIQTGTGNCHVYVDRDADQDMAVKIIINAKTSRPGTCNSAETMLVHRDIAAEFLPVAINKLQEKNVEIRGCQETQNICKNVVPATEEDWDTEYLDYILAVKVVGSVEEAIAHINTHGTRHSEAIVTNNYQTAKKFVEEVDAAAVYVNASTRFTDGFEFGFGAEMGISNQKLHARGPMGLKELTTIKYIIFGDGQIR